MRYPDLKLERLQMRITVENLLTLCPWNQVVPTKFVVFHRVKKLDVLYRIGSSLSFSQEIAMQPALRQLKPVQPTL